MFRSVIPLFLKIVAEIKQASVRVNIGMKHIANERDFGCLDRKVSETHFKLKLPFFINSMPDKNDSMPNYIIKQDLLSKASFWGITYIPKFDAYSRSNLLALSFQLLFKH